MSTELLSELTVGTEQQIRFKLPTQIANQVSCSPTVYQMLNPQIQVWCYTLGLRPNVWAIPSISCGYLWIACHFAVRYWYPDQIYVCSKLNQYIEVKIYIYNIEPHEAVPEVSRSKVHITQNKHVPIEIDCDFLNTFHSISHATLS